MGEKKMNELEERIMILSAADIKSGRRFIKGLQKIEVKRAD